MMRNDQATLVTITRNGAALTRHEITLWCAKKSVRYGEFYAATQVGINPRYVFEFDLDEYESTYISVTEGTKTFKQVPTELVFNGDTFNIIRTYEPDNYTIEVTVGR